MSLLKNDESLRESVWLSEISAIFRFDITDKVNLPSTPPNLTFEEFFILIPRNSYFNIILPQLIQFVFLNVMEDPDFSWSEVWLEYNGTPLKWHLPIGLLYDLFYLKNQISDIKDEAWEINIRYGNYPADKLFLLLNIGPESPITNSDVFMSMVKESNYIRHGNTKKVMNLTKEEHIQLWDSLISRDFKSFWKVQSTLNDYDIESLLKFDNIEQAEAKIDFPKNVPIKVYYYDNSKKLDYPTIIQGLIPPINHALILDKDNTSEIPINEKKNYYNLKSIQEAIEALLSDKFASQKDEQYGHKKSDNIYEIVIQGIIIPSTTPLLWLYLHMMYPDSFLHVVINVI